PPRSLHSFPTRRSSDLFAVPAAGDGVHGDVIRMLMQQPAALLSGEYQGLGVQEICIHLLQISPFHLGSRVNSRYIRFNRGRSQRSEEHTSELQSPYDLV